MRNTSYRGMRFDFAPNYREAFRAYYLGTLVTVITFGLAMPTATYWRAKFAVDNSAFGLSSFRLSADAHSGYSNNEEFNFHGSHGALDDTPQKRLNPAPQPTGAPNPVVGTAGATAVWAEENTRDAIFEAIKRKETYGTSGPLIRVRFFGGWKYPKSLVKNKNFVKKAYQGGVPMGGDLPKKASKAPTFAVWALKDPESDDDHSTIKSIEYICIQYGIELNNIMQANKKCYSPRRAPGTLS